MTTLEIGEHVDLDSGITIERTCDEIYKVKDLEDNSTVFLNKNEVRKLARLSGLVGIPVYQGDW